MTETSTTTRGAAKHQAILDAAEQMFLAHGFLGANMDDLAAQSRVSKQTVYKHFGSKEALFVELVTGMTHSAGDPLWSDARAGADPADRDELRAALETYARRQLEIVLSSRLLQLRRLVIGEVARFPDLARAVYTAGPYRAVTGLGELFGRLTRAGVITTDDPEVAAGSFNWLVMGGPVNAAMMLGDDAVPDADELDRHVREAVRVFLAGY